MPKAKTDLQKHTLNLFPGDYAKLQEYFPDIGAGLMIRRIVRKFLENMETAPEAPDQISIDI
jgi:hypothetical protein